MLIYFLEKSIPFNGNDLDSYKLGGTEKTLINISNELAKNNDLKVKVFNENINNKIINNVEWINIKDSFNYKPPDVLIAFSDMNLFNYFKSNKNFLWSHSVQNIEKFFRKKQIVPYIKHKPVLILEGDYHYKNRSIFTSFFGKKILKLAPDYEFINENVDLNILPSKNCIFTTKSDRNLDILLAAWDKINKYDKDAKLFINPPFKLNEKLIKQNVIIRNKGDKKDLINDLKSSRLMLLPGHKGEVFCLAAEEARELCIPIVTLGYGSLYERVIHNKTGFIAENIDDFVKYSIQLLNDDNLFLQLRKNLLDLRNSRNYSNVSNDLLQIIKN